MHLRISKVLVFGFSLETATDMATNDWAEDITAYSVPKTRHFCYSFGRV